MNKPAFICSKVDDLNETERTVLSLIMFIALISFIRVSFGNEEYGNNPKLSMAYGAHTLSDIPGLSLSDVSTFYKLSKVIQNAVLETIPGKT